MKLKMEEENDTQLPLLANEAQNQSDDDAILSQPLVASDANTARPNNKRCRKLPNDKEILGLFAFAILTWLGFVLTLYATYSCDLIHITWNPHSIQLTITGLGVRRFQTTVRKPQQQIKQKKCFDRASYVEHAEISKNEQGFFPSNELAQRASIVAPTLAGVAFAGVMIYMVVASIHVDKFTNRVHNSQYPWKTVSICYVLGGITLIGAGTAELIMILDLLNVPDTNTNDRYESPMCNVDYSTCQLGVGGQFAVTGVACCYCAALLAFYAAFVTICTKRKSGADELPVQEAAHLESLS